MTPSITHLKKADRTSQRIYTLQFLVAFLLLGHTLIAQNTMDEPDWLTIFNGKDRIPTSKYILSLSQK